MADRRNNSSTWLRADSVRFAHDGGDPVFDDLSLHLIPGWYGVVGANGAGKTTLLGILAGELQPSAGTVLRSADVAEGAIAWCRQTVELMDDDVEALAWAWDNAARRLRSRLMLDPEALDRWSTLSPGERKRWQIGAALWREPLVLLLDEPSNHLDAESRQVLAEALSTFSGIGLVVSHDRGFLERLVGTTVWVEGGAVRLFEGSYQQARALCDAERQRQSSLARARRTEERRLSRQLAARKQQRAQAERSMSASARMKDRHDHDARSAGAGIRAAHAEASLAREVAALGSRLARASEARAAVVVERQRGRALAWRHEPAPFDPLIHLATQELCAGSRVLLREVSCTVKRGDRILISGANGAGKSTLLGALSASIGWPRERLLHLPQELDAATGAALTDELRATAAEPRGRWLQLAAALGSDPERLLATVAPSPGEARKLLLARALAAHVWCLLLDEPTNHFDVPTLERLEQALVDYPGALVLVSHDQTFAAACTDQCWELSGSRLTCS